MTDDALSPYSLFDLVVKKHEPCSKREQKKGVCKTVTVGGPGDGAEHMSFFSPAGPPCCNIIRQCKLKPTVFLHHAPFSHRF